MKVLLLLAFVFGFVSAEEDVDILELTAATFDSTVSSGLWFIKHYSPYCGHCKKFAPFWQQAANDYHSLADSKDFHIASVDCSVQGDLCNTLGIKAYPTNLLYKNGQKVQEFIHREGNVDVYTPLAEFIEKWSQPGAVDADLAAQSAQVQATQTIDTTTTIAGKNELHRASVAVISPTHSIPSAVGLASPVVASLALPVAAETPAPADTDTQTPVSTNTPNPKGESVGLDAKKFDELVTNTKDGWLISFYTPWCETCKTLSPSWSELAADFRGKLNIGQVNCMDEDNARICKGVMDYPTIVFYRGSEKIVYDGLRGLGDLIAFATKAAQSGITLIDSAEFESIQKKEPVIFLYFYDTATTSEDFEALEKVSLSLIGHAPLYKTNNAALANRFRATIFPKLVVIRDGKTSYYPALAPKDMRDHKKMKSWMASTWLPILPELNTENSHEIMGGHIVVLGVLDPTNPKFEEQKAGLKSAAYEWIDQRVSEEQADKQQLRDQKQAQIENAENKGDQKAIDQAKGIQVVIPEKEQVGFAWVDGVFWEKWLQETYQVNVRKDGPCVIINQEDQGRYWPTTSSGNTIHIESSEISETLAAVLAGKLKSKSSKNNLETVFYAAKGVSLHYPYASSSLFVGILVVFVYLLRGRSGGYKQVRGHDGGILTGKLD